MNGVFNNLGGAMNAAAHWFKAAVALATSNPYLLGFTIIAVFWTGKSLKLGRILTVKG